MIRILEILNFHPCACLKNNIMHILRDKYQHLMSWFIINYLINLNYKLKLDS